MVKVEEELKKIQIITEGETVGEKEAEKRRCVADGRAWGKRSRLEER